MNLGDVFTGMTAMLPHEGQGGGGFFFCRFDEAARRFRVAIQGKLNCSAGNLPGQSQP